VIDDDLGGSASGRWSAPAFGASSGRFAKGWLEPWLCLEASRLARNGRDWHHLLELCGLVGVYVIDTDGAYDPSAPNDRLLLGLNRPDSYSTAHSMFWCITQVSPLER